MDWCSILLNFIATLFGVVIGFELENCRIRNRDKKDKAEEKKRLNKLLNGINTAISKTDEKLEDLYKVITREENNVKIVFSSKLSTWDEMKYELTKSLDDLSLLDSLSDYFMNLKIVCILQDRYLDNVVQMEKIPSEQQIGYIKIISSIKENLKGYIIDLRSRKEELQLDINKSITK